MIINKILCVAFIFLPLLSVAQDQVYTTADKESFVKIYLELKENKTNPEDLLAEVLQNADLDSETYLALRQSKKPADQNRIQELRNAAKKIQADHKASHTDQLCKKHSITISLFLDMQSRYHKEINFHEELRPYFKAYIDNKK